MSLDVTGEIVKLARELELDPDQLSFLEHADRDDVHRLRVALEDALDARNRGIYQRIESSSRLLPPSVAVKIASATFPPLILGRVAEGIPPDRSAKFLEHMPMDLMGQMLAYMNPRRMASAVRQIPAADMVPMIRELEARDDHVTMGRFLAVLTDEQIKEVVEAISDGRTLLVAGFHTEEPERLDNVVGALSDEQLHAILASADQHGLARELAVVTSRLSADVRARVDALRG